MIAPTRRHDWPWQLARREAARTAAALPAVDTALEAARGCTLARDLRARVPVPAFDTAAMDGYAVAGEPPWTVVGQVLADRGARAPGLVDHTAMEIATGAPVPPGASGVLPYEHAERTGDIVTGEAAAGKHIRRRGAECAEGTTVLTAGSAVTPTAQGLAATLGHDTVPVHPKPRASVLVTGDELISAGLPRHGEVRDAIGPMLTGLIEHAGGVLAGHRHLRDTAAALEHGITSGSENCEVLVVCGASSAGPADHLRAVLRDANAEILVDGVACRPGHPQVLARLPGGRLVVGLPGNPYAALVAALTMLEPVLATLSGRPRRRPRRLPLTGPVTSPARRTRVIPARDAGDHLVAVGHDAPALLWGAALGDVLAVLPPGWSGEPVEILPLPGPAS